MERTKILFNKPIYIGMAILELSKELMYDFHYNIMKLKYGDKIKLCYMDTDSFIYHIETNNFYEDMKENINEYDTSDFKKNNKFKMPLLNKKVIGKMKDENSGKIMTEFVSLKSKMYATKVENKENKKAKGIKKSVVKNEISFDDYKKCLNDKIKIYRTMNTIRSYKHEIYTIETNKIALSADDDKRHILKDGINTLPHGHYKIVLNNSLS